VRIAQVGASLRQPTVDGQDVLDGYGRDEIASAAQGQSLVPWPNRRGDGRYPFDGEQLELALSERHRWACAAAASDVVHRDATRATLHTSS
jgi:galactose mutarotase-like enzyme